MLRNLSLFTILSCFALLPLTAATPATTQPAAEEQPSAPSAPDKIEELSPADQLRLSEAFGHFIGRNLNNPGLQFDLESVIRGLRNGVAGGTPPMSDKEYEKMMTQLQERAYQKLATENLKAADSFMVKNKKVEGVIELEPGKLQYQLVSQGEGNAVTENSAPQIHYVGKYIDGTIFGSSEDVGGPITLPMGQTIPGFSKGIVGMKEGEKRRLFVHPDLAYGTRGQLPPNALLIFEVEVIKADTPRAAFNPSFGMDEEEPFFDEGDEELPFFEEEELDQASQ